MMSNYFWQFFADVMSQSSNIIQLLSETLKEPDNKLN